MMPVKSIDSAKKVLIVDSDPKSSASLESWFTNAGYHVTIAKKDWEAESAARENKFQLILIDWDLNGGEGGMEALWLLQSSAGAAKIAMMAAEISPDRVHEASTKGVFDWIGKPFDSNRTPKELETALKGTGAGARAAKGFSPFRWVRDHIPGVAPR